MSNLRAILVGKQRNLITTKVKSVSVAWWLLSIVQPVSFWV